MKQPAGGGGGMFSGASPPPGAASSGQPLSKAAEAVIKRSLLVGNFEAAVQCCMSTGNMADAMLLARCGAVRYGTVWRGRSGVPFRSVPFRFVSFRLVCQLLVRSAGRSVGILKTLHTTGPHQQHNEQQ